MTDNISKAAAEMGRKGGKVSSPAKSAAAKQRANPGLAEGRKEACEPDPGATPRERPSKLQMGEGGKNNHQQQPGVTPRLFCLKKVKKICFFCKMRLTSGYQAYINSSDRGNRQQQPPKPHGDRT